MQHFILFILIIFSEKRENFNKHITYLVIIAYKDIPITTIKFIITMEDYMNYGYARVSTKEQNEERQLVALKDFGISEKNIFIDKQSGKDFNRENYNKLLNTMTHNDTLVIKSIDRLGRNYEEILEQWRTLTKEKAISIVVLDMPLLDTRRSKDLTGTLISDIVLQLLSYVAQTEREFIRQRQKEGIYLAKKRGVKFGRKPKEKPNNFIKIANQWKNGDISARGAAKLLGITHQTFLRWIKEM